MAEDAFDSDPAHGAAAVPPAVAGGAPVIPVSLLVSSARLLIERHIGLTWVSGEISNFTRAASGHCYFNLKDAQAQVRCVLFRQRAANVAFALRDGLSVEVRATPSIYEARGEFQLNVDNLRLAGIGALYERYARLKARLEAAGWFAAERKRPLPSYPRAVGVVTSMRAAALRDILTTLERRWPTVRVIVYPTLVQGADAASAIAQAIRDANARAEVDVLIVARGGGSIEDLWPFNEESVARALFESMLPVVSGVGHETDFTICDFVADARAPTPTAAAALVVPDRHAVAQRVHAQLLRLARAGMHALETRAQRLDRAARGLVHPAARVAQQGQRSAELARRLVHLGRADDTARGARFAALKGRLLREMRGPLPAAARLQHLAEALERAGRERVTRAGERVARLAQNVAHLNPQSVLERGYAIVAAADGAIVVDAQQVDHGDAVTLTFARGGAAATIVRRASG
ncbi:MAG: exodeoxyribonuclease VII large subunit [Burkholderiales bacterium]|nr:exodeoxyribonuclease VII large subunit [Burkholderiales bacterium]